MKRTRADVAVMDYGACAACTTDEVQVWHDLAECDRLRKAKRKAKA